MKKIIFALLALGIVCVSCKSSSGSAKGDKAMERVERKPMGLWNPMEWTSSDKLEKDGSAILVSVPGVKNNVELKCKNYSSFWISSVNDNNTVSDNRKVFNGDFFTVKCEGNTLVVSFEANADAERTADVVIQSGDIFSRIKFVQKGEN